MRNGKLLLRAFERGQDLGFSSGGIFPTVHFHPLACFQVFVMFKEVLDLMKNKFVVVSLYVDERKVLPAAQQQTLKQSLLQAELELEKLEQPKITLMVGSCLLLQI